VRARPMATGLRLRLERVVGNGHATKKRGEAVLNVVRVQAVGAAMIHPSPQVYFLPCKIVTCRVA